MTVTIAGSVETFDEARFVEGFARQMGVSAADVSVSVEAGSVLVTATVRYDSIAEARTGGESLQLVDRRGVALAHGREGAPLWFSRSCAKLIIFANLIVCAARPDA